MDKETLELLFDEYKKAMETYDDAKTALLNQAVALTSSNCLGTANLSEAATTLVTKRQACEHKRRQFVDALSELEDIPDDLDSVSYHASELASLLEKLGF